MNYNGLRQNAMFAILMSTNWRRMQVERHSHPLAPALIISIRGSGVRGGGGGLKQQNNHKASNLLWDNRAWTCRITLRLTVCLNVSTLTCLLWYKMVHGLKLPG